MKITAFQQKVYDATRLIPRGSVVTYGELARRIGCKSAQAVGQALRRNPFAPEVPCHRVVAADGNTLTNLVFNVCRYEQIVRLGMN